MQKWNAIRYFIPIYKFIYCNIVFYFLLGSDSESEESAETEFSSVYYSVYETRSKQKQQSMVPVKYNAQSYFTLNMLIGKGLLNMNPLGRDSAGNVIPGQQGEFLLLVEGAYLFVVSGYCGDDDLGFVCVQAKNGNLHHCGKSCKSFLDTKELIFSIFIVSDLMSIPSQSPPLKEFGTAVGRHLHSTICKSEPGVLVNAKNRGGEREMITVAIKIQAKHETHHVKVIFVIL